MTETALAGMGMSATSAPHHRDALDIMADSALAAVRDSGLSLKDIDGIFTATAQVDLPTLALSEHLGITPRYLDSTVHGGASNLSHIHHAVSAIRDGKCEAALVVYGSTQRTMLKATGKRPAVASCPPVESLYNPLFPISSYALMAQRHMLEFGTTRRQLSSVAVAASRWGALNPAAQRRDIISAEDVTASPKISSPFHKLDCCLITDGAGAVVVTTAQRAARLGRAPVAILGSGEYSSHEGMMAMKDLVRTGAAVSSQAAFAQAGLGPADMDVAQVYDAFTINTILLLEDLGFCAKGTGGQFIEEGHTSPGGRLPTNTSGGGLAFSHPGMFGIYTVLEAMTQLRGQGGDRQVPGAAKAVAHGIGGTMSAHTTLVLGG
ncbi:acetyl-CoA acetyltransferase [Arthrobacter sp. HY1533]|uniref:acetyl-CoA acetyltransferase n=1 Tax=Arthrobacter sp. HY1533 TaxID=2970919 RepID=UPI0022B9F645|nr:acetyl-CoA acetyltransferase [Arthrobacter sp. HY1533]